MVQQHQYVTFQLSLLHLCAHILHLFLHFFYPAIELSQLDLQVLALFGFGLQLLLEHFHFLSLGDEGLIFQLYFLSPGSKSKGGESLIVALGGGGYAADEKGPSGSAEGGF